MPTLTCFLIALALMESSTSPWRLRVEPVYRVTDLEGDAEMLDTSGVSTVACLWTQGNKRLL